MSWAGQGWRQEARQGLRIVSAESGQRTSVRSNWGQRFVRGADGA